MSETTSSWSTLPAVISWHKDFLMSMSDPYQVRINSFLSSCCFIQTNMKCADSCPSYVLGHRFYDYQQFQAHHDGRGSLSPMPYLLLPLLWLSLLWLSLLWLSLLHDYEQQWQAAEHDGWCPEDLVGLGWCPEDLAAEFSWSIFSLRARTDFEALELFCINMIFLIGGPWCACLLGNW